MAARGLDLPDLGLVIHAELPINKATMLHRSGRTGRAGKKGISVLLVPHSRRRKAEMLLGSAGVEAVWSGAPTAEEIRAQDEQRLLAAPVFAEEGSDEDAGLIETLVKERTPDDLARALLVLLRKNLPAPEDLSDPGEARSASRAANAMRRAATTTPLPLGRATACNRTRSAGSAWTSAATATPTRNG